MDPVTIGIVVFTIVVAVICTFIFKMATKETSFEEAYGQSARKLLTEDKVSKAKPKAGKPKKSNKVGNVVNSSEVAQLPEEIADVAKVDNHSAVKDTQKDTRNQQPSHEAQKVTRNQQPPQEVQKVVRNQQTSHEAQKDNRNQQPPHEAQKVTRNQQPSHEAPKVTRNQQPPQEAQKDNLNQQLSPEAQKDIRIQQLSREVTTLRTELTQKTNASTNEANALKATIEKVKAENAELSKAHRELTTSKAATENKLAKLKDMERAVKHMTNEVAIHEKELLKSNANLKAQQDKYEVYESSVRTKVAETVQLREENKRLAIQNVQKDNRIQQFSHEVHALRTELTQKANAGGDEVNALKATIEKIKTENAELSNAYREMIASKTAVENELVELKDMERAVKHMTNEVAILEEELLKCKTNLKAQQDKYEVYESSVRNKVAETVQLREENQRLAIQNVQNDNRIQQLSHEVHALRSELTQKGKTADDEVNALKATIEKAKAENAELSNAYRETIASKTAVENELVELKHIREQWKSSEHEVQIAHQRLIDLKQEFDRMSNAYDELKKSHSHHEAKIVADSTQINTTSPQLNFNGSSHDITHIDGDVELGTVIIPTDQHPVQKSNGTSHLDDNVDTAKRPLSATEPQFTKKQTAVVAPNSVGSGNDEVASHLRKIEWPVVDWKDAPAEILICSSWWGWTEHQAMTKSESGFIYYLDPTEKSGTSEGENFFFKFIVDSSWQCSERYPIAVDENGIKNNYFTFAS